jgi:hypothetical protein
VASPEKIQEFFNGGQEIPEIESSSSRVQGSNSKLPGIQRKDSFAACCSAWEQIWGGPACKPADVPIPVHLRGEMIWAAKKTVVCPDLSTHGKRVWQLQFHPATKNKSP